MLRVPKNKIVESKYTSGGEYIFAKTYEKYQGYYYETNGKTFAGKEFDINNKEIIKINKDTNNKLKTNPFTYVYGMLSNNKLINSKFNSIPFSPSNKDYENGFVMRYFIKQVNSNPIIIKETDKNGLEQQTNNPLYQTLEVKYKFNISDKELDEFDKKMPGLKAFLSTEILPTSSDESLF